MSNIKEEADRRIGLFYKVNLKQEDDKMLPSEAIQCAIIMTEEQIEMRSQLEKEYDEDFWHMGGVEDLLEKILKELKSRI